MQETKTLTISNPPQFGVIIERNDKGLEHSIFKDVYDEAFERATDIIQANGGNNPNGSGPHEQFSNTVISFVGKRGTGKSTAMCSFSSFLSSSKFDKIKSDRAKEMLSGKYFYCLDAIDSVQLGTKETIIGRISAAMFKEYENMTNCPMSISVEQKRDFIKQVNTVNKYAVMYHNGEWFKQTDSLLVDTCRVSSLRCEMQKLIDAYLKLKSGTYDIKDKYLVVSIDDLDMGIENSYAIMEEIRKFLCIENIIVLVTLRMDQVHSALRSKFEQQLNSKLDYGDNRILIDDLAYRYIEKLFPYSRQIQMPTLSLNNLKTWEADFGFEIPAENQKTILPTVLHLIWKKTLIIPVCNSDGDHFLVPRNLRSLCNFVVFLRNLPDINTDTPTNDSVKLQSNLAAFSRYLVSNVRSYERGSISYYDRAFSETLITIINNIEHTPLEKINSKIVGEILYYLNNYRTGAFYKKLFDNGENNFYFDEPLLNASLCNNCISLGDLIYVLGEIDNKTKCRYIKYLIEVIRTLWSAKMTEEYYCNSVTVSNGESALSAGFMNTVGKLIINPDPCKFNNKYYGGFEKISTDVKEEVKTSALLEVYCGKEYDPSWRTLQKKDNNQIIHPYALFSNVLNIVRDKRYLIKGDMVINGKMLWLPLPLYSLDYMHRFYELSGDELNVGEDRYELKSIVNKLCESSKNTVELLANGSRENTLPLSKYIKNDVIKHLTENIEKLHKIAKAMLNMFSAMDFKEKLESCNDKESFQRLLNEINSYNLSFSLKEALTKLNQTSSDTDFEQIKKMAKDLIDDFLNERHSTTGKENKEG